MTDSTDRPTETKEDDGATKTFAGVINEDSLAYKLRIPVALVILVLVLRPLVEQPWLLGFGQIAITMLIWMLFVSAFNLLFGYSGLLSFGHAMFFGTGIYAVAIGISKFNAPFLVSAIIGIILAGAMGYVIGRLIVQKGEIYFAMLTLAFAQAIFFTVNNNPFGLTGGSDGLTQGTLPPWVESFRGQIRIVLGGLEFDWYWLAAAIFLVAMLALWQVVRSPFGRSLLTIRENEELARAMGVDTRRYKVSAFTFSAIFAAVAGILAEINNHGASLENFGPFTSGDAVLMAILGGVNYFFGPIAGAFLWLFSEEYLTDFETLNLVFVEVDLSGVLSYWQFLLGFIFVVIVVVSPKEGIWGYIRGALKRLYRLVRRVAG
ncbi:MAG: branched-chain amino acid ABC transporter permease [Halobacteria archaeon]|nr:branched-chain amino acid ABC transporter permease [Halobacteria archaeon]